MATVILKHISKVYGDLAAVDDVSVEIREGELLALLGPSGCGKTTTLRMIAGFAMPTAGSICFGKHDVTRIPVNKRNVGMVFQGYALFPHLTVMKNVAFGLKIRGWDKERARKRVAEMLDWVQLSKLSEYRPRELSGGQQQRVALARAMANQPDVLLLDEPFSALDAKLRQQMRREIRELQQDAGITAVFVTHDQEEAMSIADRIGVMNHGKLEQLGSAEDLYKRPISRFVAGFIGKCNLLEGQLCRSGSFETRGGKRLSAKGHGAQREAGPAALCFRPEDAALSTSRDEYGNSIEGSVRAATYLGTGIEYEVLSDAGEKLIVTLPSSSTGAGAYPPTSRCFVNWQPSNCFVVD